MRFIYLVLDNTRRIHQLDLVGICGKKDSFRNRDRKTLIPHCPSILVVRRVGKGFHALGGTWALVGRTHSRTLQLLVCTRKNRLS